MNEDINKPAGAQSELNAGLADKIARAIFECGDEPGHKIKRIQFKSGKWPDEINMSGLNEQALSNVIKQFLVANIK